METIIQRIFNSTYVIKATYAGDEWSWCEKYIGLNNENWIYNHTVSGFIFFNKLDTFLFWMIWS